jgi:hypothetical protein
MEIITNEDWFPDFGAFQIRRNPKTKMPEARHEISNWFLSDRGRICEEIYKCYRLLPNEKKDRWVYFRY